MDPILLDGAIAATRDTGAYRLWSSHPATTRIARPATAALSETAAREPGEPVYALLQALIALRALEQRLHESGSSHQFAVAATIHHAGREHMIDVPALSIGPT
ncbi:hypothetical protein PABY_24150 [Pyrodictium abyssi]|uniref:Uncharacterized protein n=2 Tax=Pyrodictium abyssi TaxID=54256 RepID=A0ABN6ZRL8_9CREN|nr:hypothetical protein PABY_24150 [Pyrodictium abyssi]